jgi:hypothetical protein
VGGQDGSEGGGGASGRVSEREAGAGRMERNSERWRKGERVGGEKSYGCYR